MRLHSNIFSTIPLVKNEVNVIVFEDLKKQFQFRELVRTWMTNPNMDFPYLIISIDGQNAVPKDLNLLTLNAGNLYFFKDKQQSKQLLELVKFEIENSPELLVVFSNLLQEIENVLGQVIIEFEGVEIHHVLEGLTIESLLKLVRLDLHIPGGKALGIFEYQMFLLRSWVYLSHNRITNVCFYDFPENELEEREIHELFEFANASDCTLICLTTNFQVMNQVSIKNIHFIKSNGDRYEIENLYQELVLFFDEPEVSLVKITKNLAIRDFYQNLDFLDPKWKDFLLSRNF